MASTELFLRTTEKHTDSLEALERQPVLTAMEAQFTLENWPIQDGHSGRRLPFPHPPTLCHSHLWELHRAPAIPILLLFTKTDGRHLLLIPVIGFCAQEQLTHWLEGGWVLVLAFIPERQLCLGRQEGLAKHREGLPTLCQNQGWMSVVVEEVASNWKSHSGHLRGKRLKIDWFGEGN